MSDPTEAAREALAQVIDPAAFEDHALEAAGKTLAILQWGARRKMARDAADRAIAAGYITIAESDARVADMRERAAHTASQMSGVPGIRAIRTLPLTLAAKPEQCTASHPNIDGGAQCRYLAGHLAADIPHTTPNGLWWKDDPQPEPFVDPEPYYIASYGSRHSVAQFESWDTDSLVVRKAEHKPRTREQYEAETGSDADHG